MYVYKENAQKGDETGSETVDISEIMVGVFLMVYNNMFVPTWLM